MAKELPYFQFEPAEYLTKDVSFCSLEVQGFFINLCSYYWQRSCELTTSQLLKRLDYPILLKELIDEDVVSVNDGVISVRFLDAQYEKATTQSKINSINGSKGGRPKKKNPKETEIKPKLNRKETETKGIREDKIREDKIREDKSKAKAFKSEKEFLEGFNKAKAKATGKAGRFKVMSKTDKNNFKTLNENYSKEDFNHAFKMMSKSQWVKDNDMLTISHFLRNEMFNKYLNQTDSLPMAQGLIEGN